MGDLGQNLKMEKPKFLNLLILEHLKSHFIKPQVMCFEINGLKFLKLTVLRFLPSPPFTYTTLIPVKTFLLLKHYLLSINSHEFILKNARKNLKMLGRITFK